MQTYIIMDAFSHNEDILFCIVSKIKDVNEMLKLQLLSKFYYDFIKNTFWTNVIVETDTNAQLEYFLNNFNFSKYNINHLSLALSKKQLEKISKCSVIKLSFSTVSDDLLYNLRQCNSVS